MFEDFDFRSIEGDGFALEFLTGLTPPGLPPLEGARRLFADLAGVLNERRIRPFQEKIYGLAEARDEILSIRREAYASGGLDPDGLPASFHQGKASDPETFRGVQLFGVIPEDAGVDVASVPEGRVWTGKDFRMLYVPGVRGLEEDGAPAQARRMFLNADAAIGRHGFAFTQVARTWIYLKRLLAWYGEFNGVRNAFFAERGVGADAERSLPASTGIQGTSSGEECSMDVLAVDGPGLVASPLSQSSRQGSAADYGSSFSRAMSVRAGGVELILVSGTASIDPSGATVHLGDIRAQIVETLRCILDLLEGRGAGLKDIHLATVFGKTPAILEAFPEVVRAEGLDGFPFVPVVADVCRDELLVEIEALACVPIR